MYCSRREIAEGLKRDATSRISKFTPDGKFVKSWGTIGVRHGEFRTPHAMVFDSKGRLWVVDRVSRIPRARAPANNPDGRSRP